MATLTGMDRQARAIENAIVKAMRGPVKDFVIQDAKNTLNAQIQPGGEPFPTKAESTKKQYRRHGWNTEKFLVRTGKSTKLQHVINKRGNFIELVVTPVGHEILSFNVPSRTKWMGLDAPAVARVTEILQEAVRNGL